MKTRMRILADRRIILEGRTWYFVWKGIRIDRSKTTRGIIDAFGPNAGFVPFPQIVLESPQSPHYFLCFHDTGESARKLQVEVATLLGKSDA